MPFAKMNEDFPRYAAYAEQLAIEDIVIDAPSGLKISDIMTLSQFSITKGVYYHELLVEPDDFNRIGLFFLLCGHIVLLGLVMIFLLFRKATAVILLDLFAAALAFWYWFYSLAGKTYVEGYSYSIGFYGFYPCCLIILLCGIWMFALKRRIKAQKR